MSATVTVIERATIARIREEHEAAERAGAEWLTHAIECGRLLADVKRQLRHGEFGLWLAEHFDLSTRTAQTYMQLAAAPEEKRNAVAGLSLRQARDAIAEPKPRRASASDAGALLQALGGSSPAPRELSARVDEARDRLRATSPTVWTEPEHRKLERASGVLAEALGSLTEIGHAQGLSRYAIAETLREAVIEARKAAALLEELAFSFEK